MSVRPSALPFYDQVLKPASYSEVSLFSFGDHQDSSTSPTQHALHLEEIPLQGSNKGLKKVAGSTSGAFGGWSSLDSIHEHQNDEDDNNPFAFAPYSEYLSDDSSQASPYHSPIYADDYYQEQTLENFPPYIKMRYAIRALESKTVNSEQQPLAPEVAKQVTRKRKRKRQSESSPSRYQPVREEPEVKRRKKTNRNNYPRSSSDQKDCCIKGCCNAVTNRLRFSLRCTQPEDYKGNYLDKGWNKVCHHHYFSDLYKFKKSNKH